MSLTGKVGWLFDLDGTLLPLRVDEFIPRYVETLRAFVEQVVDGESFERSLLAATARMIEDHSADMSNAEVFWQEFTLGLGGAQVERVVPFIERYYRESFPHLGDAYQANPWARQALEAVLAQGGELILATNPVFPLPAIEERMRWAGIVDLPFQLITSYETMHFCKPRLEYYQEILNMTGHEVTECIMVGNDIQEDIVPARKLGMATYLVEGMVIDRTGAQFDVNTPAGTLQELAMRLERKG